MAKDGLSQCYVDEVDSEGQVKATIEISAASHRLLPRTLSAKPRTSLLIGCLSPFLPVGYPSSVTADYTPYQIYDSLQAFASTIAGLLASRAVFKGLGVGSEDASLVTTMLLYIAQETIGRIATILFAHRFSQRIEAEVKFYRFFADMVNDTAFVLDCLSPAMPILARSCILCISNACRAVCGVAGGSSKAILSSHFAKSGNIGELNAKDGSQETVVSLLGMWAGGFVVSKVHGTTETWLCLIPLLALHLWANWKAVRSVRLNALNANRAGLLFSAALRGVFKSVDEVGKEEAILGLPKIWGRDPLQASRHIRIGVGVNELLQYLPVEPSSREPTITVFTRLVKIFQDEDYLLWIDLEKQVGLVLLKTSATAETQARGYCHALRGLSRLHHNATSAVVDLKNESQPSTVGGRGGQSLSGPDRRRADEGFRLLQSTLIQNRDQWSDISRQVQRSGWNLALTNLAKHPGCQIRTRDVAEGKKEK